MTTFLTSLGKEPPTHELRGVRWTSRYVQVGSALLMIAMLTGAGALYAAGGAMATAPVHTSRKYWIGKNLAAAEKEFGTPTFSEQLIETGGMLVIYARKEDPVHFVFETNASNVIIKAARVE